MYTVHSYVYAVGICVLYTVLNTCTMQLDVYTR